MGLREDLDRLSLTDRRIEKHVIPEWENKTVFIRALKSREADAFEEARLREKGKDEEVNLKNFRAAYCVQVLCDEEGNRLYADEEAALLGEWPVSVIQPIFTRGQALSGFRKEDVDFFVKGSKSPDSASDSSSRAA